MNGIAHVAHSLSGRTRLKVPNKRGDIEFFSLAGQWLSECPGVTQVEVNARTGSLLIRHTVPFPQIAAFADDHNLFTLQADNESSGSISHQASANLAWVNTRLAQLSAGTLDLRSVLFLSLLVLCLVQIYRGQILIPAGALLWNMLQLLHWEEAELEKTEVGGNDSLE